MSRANPKSEARIPKEIRKCEIRSAWCDRRTAQSLEPYFALRLLMRWRDRLHWVVARIFNLLYLPAGRPVARIAFGRPHDTSWPAPMDKAPRSLQTYDTAEFNFALRGRRPLAAHPADSFVSRGPFSGLRISLALFALLLGAAPSLQAYPEFRVFIVQRSGRPVDCAMCHVSHDGPEGTGPGQIGSLTPAELDQLGRARTAFAPGSKVENPILNAFGNHIVQSIGLTKFRELRLAPAELAKALPQDSDLDGDGIPDVREYLDGTNPLDRNDGQPWLLFKNNFKRNLFEILLTLAATVAGLYGLGHLLRGFAKATEATSEDEEEHALETIESELS